MKTMRKFLVYVLSFAMIISCVGISTYAAAADDLAISNFNLEVTESEGTLTVELVSNKDVEAWGGMTGLMSVSDSKGQDASEYFTLSAITSLIGDNNSDVSAAKWSASAVDYNNGDAVEAGTWTTYTYNVSDEVADDDYSFKMTFVDGDCCDVNFDDYSCSGKTVSVTYVVGEGATGGEVIPTYGANIAVNDETEATAVSVGDTVKVDLGAGSNYHATEMTISYNSALVTFDEENSVLGTAKVTNKNGLIELADYGAEKTAAEDNYVLAFTAKADGNAEFKITEAAFGTGTSAETADLTAATVSAEGITIEIAKKQFEIDLDDIYESNVTSVEDGEDFTFWPEEATGAYYNYQLPVAKYDDDTTAAVTDNGNGTWTVANVSGNLTITGTRTAKDYDVTITEGMTESNDGDTATYGVEYHFTVKADVEASTEKGYTYKLESITIDGQEYTGYSNNDKAYTIPGNDIIGDIVITISKEEVDEDQYTITIGGAASGAIEGGNTITVDKSSNSHTITLNGENFKGYVLGVGASEGVTVTDNGDGTWTLSGLTPDATIEITKTVDIAGATNAKTGEGNDYVQADNVALWLVQMPDNMENMTGAKNQNYYYNGEKMYWSERHGAYVVTVFAAEAPVIAPNMFTIETVAATPEIAAADYDVNMSGKVDANDAQLIWNMYNAWYNNFTANVTQEKFILADANGDSILNMEDATVIINKILDIAGN